MTPKEQVEYLRKTLSKWEQVKESLEPDDKFNEVIDKKCTEIKTKLKNIISKENPEDFLV